MAAPRIITGKHCHRFTTEGDGLTDGDWAEIARQVRVAAAVLGVPTTVVVEVQQTIPHIAAEVPREAG